MKKSSPFSFENMLTAMAHSAIAGLRKSQRAEGFNIKKVNLSDVLDRHGAERHGGPS
jgi:hypothetical protein